MIHENQQNPTNTVSAFVPFALNFLKQSKANSAMVKCEREACDDKSLCCPLLKAFKISKANGEISHCNIDFLNATSHDPS